jgi:hypothetical protein
MITEIYADKIPKVPVPMSVVVSVAQERHSSLPTTSCQKTRDGWLTYRSTRGNSPSKVLGSSDVLFKLRQVNPRAQMPRFKKKAPTQTFGVDSNSVSYRDGIETLLRCSQEPW